MKRTPGGFKYLLLFLILAGVLLLSLRIGSVPLSWQEVLTALFPKAALARGISPSPTAVVILWELRLTRSLLAALVGAGLALAGAGFQGLLRNPLADPFVLGASSGAALGGTLVIALGWGTALVPPAAFAGALLAIGAAYVLGTAGGRSSTVSLLLAGTALSSLFASLVSLIMVIKDRELYQIFFWLLGSFSSSQKEDLAFVLPYAVTGAVLLFFLSRPLNMLTFGEDSAQNMGVNVALTRGLVVAAASLVTAAAVAVSGIIGFVGLLAPHAARMLFGPSHKTLMPAAALIGGILLVAADTAARRVLAPVELPVGVLTSLLGAPFFLLLLKSKGDSQGDKR